MNVFIFNVINFIVLILLLRKFFFQKVMAIIAERDRVVQAGIDDAEKARLQLENAETERSRILQEAIEQKDEIVKDARTEASAIRAKETESAMKESEIILSNANQHATRIKKEMLSEVERNVAQIVTKEIEDKITAN